MTSIDLTQSPERAGYAIHWLEWSGSTIEAALFDIESGKTEIGVNALKLVLGLQLKALRELEEGRQKILARIKPARRAA